MRTWCELSSFSLHPFFLLPIPAIRIIACTTVGHFSYMMKQNQERFVSEKNSLPESSVGGDNGLIDEIAPVCPICQQFFYWFLTHHSEVLCDSTLIRFVS